MFAGKGRILQEAPISISRLQDCEGFVFNVISCFGKKYKVVSNRNSPKHYLDEKKEDHLLL